MHISTTLEDHKDSLSAAWRRSLPIAALLVSAGVAGSAEAQPPGAGTVWVPESSVQFPGDTGQRVHTNVRTLVPYEGIGSLRPPAHAAATHNTDAPPVSGTFFETPASLACVYQLVAPVAGCNPNVVTLAPTGGARAIAIVDAYHYASAASDLATFSNQFGLPAATLSVVYATGTRPAVDPTGGWALEAALDIEWAHAMAPKAKIILVEAASSNFSDLLKAVSVASTLVAQAGGGEVSMSWGGSEFPGETSYDSYFTTPGVVYVASAGDSPGTEWPSVSPNVVSAGGTSTSRDPAAGKFEQEYAWQVTGGGPSVYEARPAFQSGVTSVVGTRRGVPDIAFDADPNSGVWVFDAGYWYILGGTSVAAPSLAGIINAAGKFSASSAVENSLLYQGLLGANFTDVHNGNCGPYAGYIATSGWDFCTGIGSPVGYAGK